MAKRRNKLNTKRNIVTFMAGGNSKVDIVTFWIAIGAMGLVAFFVLLKAFY